MRNNLLRQSIVNPQRFARVPRIVRFAKFLLEVIG